ncbi:CocE/NonD family hydrolase [Frankia sp. B2]|uniref:CocE/NonD family hydrolase n=1 Tax=unclassified Frankia TaxID=2632575 RepID=UPI000461D3FE|nr:MULTISPECIES: CocE/NonD family hydrolase [unclassified Frankia]KDA44584.1 hypothetical protein BMG523Draft_00434 [Frankia sp. BMG5.23]TFE32169.1 CocE/NonD family hydrolase [Frankia sp. B2]
MTTAAKTTNVFDFAPNDRTLLDAEIAALENLESGDFKNLPPATVAKFGELRGAGTFTATRIPGADADVQLDAGVLVPLKPGPHPVVIMPAPLAPTGWKSYPGMLLNFALKGYLAVAYSERGIADSTGKIDVAGPRDRADGSAVIDWVLNTYPDRADQDRIGFAGSSYGAGQSLIIAAHDDRVRAVCAQSAWADLGRSLYENETRHLLAFEELAKLFGEENLSAEVREIFDDFRANRNIERLLEFSAVRSPVTYLNELNARRVPIFLGTYWHETIFSVPAVVEFFNALIGPKRLLVLIGDHGGDEIKGFLGGISRPTATTFRWLDRFVADEENGVENDGDVHTEYMHNLFTIKKLADWDSYTLPPRRYYLNAPLPGTSDGSLTPQPNSGWSHTFRAGTDTPALIAPALVKTGVLERLGAPIVYETSEISREDAAVWSTEPLNAPSQITGTVSAHLTVTPSAKSATLVAHLFDVDPGTGKAKIITSAPFTLLNDREGETQTIDIHLQPADYRITPGHQIQLVVDTKDRFFGDATVTNSKIEISSTDGSSSYLNIPLDEIPLEND